jgi:hypothetical protein
MKTIASYSTTLLPQPCTLVLPMPQGARILSVAVNKSTFSVTVLVDTAAPTVSRSLYVIDPGQTFTVDPAAPLAGFLAANPYIPPTSYVFDLGEV